MDAEWEQEASLKLRAMNPAATDIYAKHGRIRDCDDLEGLLDELAAAHAEGQDVLVMAESNRQVYVLNDAMQARIIADRDPDDEVVIRWDDGPDGSTRTVGVGDRIRTRRNDYDLVTATGAAVTNGATWNVTHVQDGGLWVRSDERGHLFLPPSYLARRDEKTDRPFVELAYASTVHSAQGRTVDQAVMVVGAHTEAELLYVGMTRGRSSNIAVADAGDDDDGLTLFAAALQNPSSDTAAVLDVIAGQREAAAARRAARERAAAEKAAREQAAAEKAAREQAEQERAAALATAVQKWRWGLPDGLRNAEVADLAAAQPWAPAVDVDTVVAAYRQGQQAIGRVRSQPAGYRPSEVAEQAKGLADIPPEQLAARYRAAAAERVDGAFEWLGEHGWRLDDEQEGDRDAVVAEQFGLLALVAERMVEVYDEQQRAVAEASVEDLPKGTPLVEALRTIVEEWGGTRYLDDAMAALADLQAQEQEAREQERPSQGGPGLGGL